MDTQPHLEPERDSNSLLASVSVVEDHDGQVDNSVVVEADTSGLRPESEKENGSDNDNEPPYSIFTKSEKWTIVSIIGLAALFRCFVIQFS